MLTIRPAGLLFPVDGVIALFVTGLAELIAGDDEGESFQLDPLPKWPPLTELTRLQKRI